MITIDKSLKKILIIKNCCIGDVLMTTPLVSSVRACFPDAHIDYMVGQWSKAAIEGNGDINKVITYVALRPENMVKLLAIRKQHYDLIINCDIGIKPALQSYIMGKKYRIGFDVHKKGFLLTHKVERNPGDMHEVKGYMMLSKFLEPEKVELKMKFSVDNIHKKWADDFISENELSGRELIGIFPGGGHNPGADMPNKRWPSNKYAAVCEHLLDKNYSVLVFGSKNDSQVMDEVNPKNRPEAISVQTPSIKHLAALVSNCKLFITNDCGPMHLSAAIGTPTLSIWGPTDPKLLAPLGDEHHYINSTLDCSPCFKQIIGKFEPAFTACNKTECMDSISVEKVLDRIDMMLAGRAPER